MAEPLWTGDIFADKYRVETILGKGGMGMVLGARHLGLDEPVAIKVLLPALLEMPDMVERFLREARAASKIKSEHVVRVMDVDVLPASGVPYIVMERLEGMDLGQVKKKSGKLPIAQVVGWVIDICEAIAAAHALGIIHRDLKPANLFLARRPDGSTCVKVVDFGIAKLAPRAGTTDQRVTQTGAALGSPLYMAPEQMTSTRDVDARADIWSLGVILYELLTGELRNVMERAVVLAAGGTIQAEHLLLHPKRAPQEAPAPPGTPEGGAPGRLRDAMEAVERERIVRALDQCRGNQTRAAEVLGISRRTLVEKLGMYGIPRPRKRSADGPDGPGGRA